MKIYKETESMKPLYVTTLDSGEILCVFNGYAKSTTGKIYHPVMKSENDELILAGWSDEIDSSVVIE